MAEYKTKLLRLKLQDINSLREEHLKIKEQLAMLEKREQELAIAIAKKAGTPIVFYAFTCEVCGHYRQGLWNYRYIRRKWSCGAYCSANEKKKHIKFGDLGKNGKWRKGEK